MPTEIHVSDLRELVDETARVFYAETQGRTVQLNLHRVEAGRIHVGLPAFFDPGPDITGFLVAKGGSGIYRISGDLEGFAGNRGRTYDIVPIDVKISGLALENRREFFRCRFDDPPEAILTAGDPPAELRVSVLDFSAGGMRIRSPSPLELGVGFHIHFAPTLGSTIELFEFDAEVVSDLGMISPALRKTYGLSFIGGDGRHDTLKSRITRFCNAFVIQKDKRTPAKA